MKNNYITLLKENQLKATFQRISILETIDKHGHISIDGIYEEVSKVHTSLSLATVYKNILLMVENNVLVEVPVSGQKSKYELKKEDHIHLICTLCGSVEDKSPGMGVRDIFQNLSQEENFTLNNKQINLYGICECCKEKSVDQDLNSAEPTRTMLDPHLIASS
jgi:Fur family peroxide stress response transcriptional regulator